MIAYKCDDCGVLFEVKQRAEFYYSVREGVGAFYRLEGNLDLCEKCWNKMLKEVFKTLEGRK